MVGEYSVIASLSPLFEIKGVNVRGKRMFMANMSYKVKGIFLILCSAVSFSAMSVFVRLSGDVPVMQKAFFRNIIAVLVTLLMLRRKKEPIHIKK